MREVGLVHVLEQIVDRALIGMGQRRHGAAIGHRSIGHQAGDLERDVAQLLGMVVVDLRRANHLGVTIDGQAAPVGLALKLGSDGMPPALA